MSKITLNKTYGIHTIELYVKDLKYSEVQRVIDFLMKEGKIQKIKSDPYNIDQQFKSTYFVKDGLRLRIYQSHNKSNGIGFIINPSTLLVGKYQPLNLWVPTIDTVDKLLKRLITFMNKCCGLSLHPKDFSLSQLDITYNDKLEQATAADLIGCYRKGLIPRNYQRHNSKDKEEKRHFYAIYTNKIMFKLYDKIYELEQNDRCPKELKGDKILRYEISMKREAFLKKLGLDRKDTLYDMLNTAYNDGKDMIDEYLDKKLHPFPNRWASYETAKKKIKSGIKSQKLQEQMLYLIKKVSDSSGLDTATRKLKEHYKDVDDRRIKKIFSAFDELGISPITLPKK